MLFQSVQSPLQWHNAVHLSLVVLQTHFLLQIGTALHPHLISCLHVFDTSSCVVQIGSQWLLFLTQPNLSGVWRFCSDSKHRNQILAWYTLLFVCSIKEAWVGGRFCIIGVFRGNISLLRSFTVLARDELSYKMHGKFSMAWKCRELILIGSNGFTIGYVNASVTGGKDVQASQHLFQKIERSYLIQ